jgi:hypothetical protein
MAVGITEYQWRRILRGSVVPAVIAGLCLGAPACSGGGSSGYRDGGLDGSTDMDGGVDSSSGEGTGGASGEGTGGATGTGTGEPGDPCNGNVDCTPGSICWNEICIGEGSLRFSLAWDVSSDFDLHVLTPNDVEVYYSNRTGDGANLDVDDCIGSSCRNPEGTHVENIYWADAAPTGTYEVWAVNYNGAETGSFTIEVQGGTGGPFSGTLAAESRAESEHFTVTY